MLDAKKIHFILLGPPVILIIGLIGFHSNKKANLNDKKTYYTQNEKKKECITMKKI
jgi:hypothetical protein